MDKVENSGATDGATRAAGPAGLAGLTQGLELAGFTTRAVYLNADDERMGARFQHASGMPVDVLFFASVPQVSIYARTLPVSEKGEPHTGEHLLIGKGRVGKYLNSLLEMRMGGHTAGTYTDLTNYQFHSAGGPAGFYELVEKYLEALLHPDFTDEEIRREVANLEVVTGEDGRLRLEEKGTVYNEMVSTMEKPDSNNWDQLGRLVFGHEHPLARNQGGLPAAIRDLTVDEVRRFHAANYHLGPNMAMVAALPLSWRIGDFLEQLDRIFRKLSPAGQPASYATLPPFTPAPEPEIRIGTFPSNDANAPQTALLAWRPVAGITREEKARLSFLLALLAGGETSYLYRDLVDQATRVLDSGATGVGYYVDSPPMSYAMISVDGLPPASIETARLEELRTAVLSRIRWLAALGPGSAELAEVASKTRSRIASNRRSMLKFMDDPPHFGDRGAGISWHRHLDHLDAGGGFERSVSLKEVYDRLEGELDRGENPWAAIIARWGLAAIPFVSAVRPDASELAREKSDRIERLAREEQALIALHGAADGQAALAALSGVIARRTQELAERDRSIPQPGFLPDPPLELDDVEHTVEPLPGGRTLVRTHFGSTPFTDIRLMFDLNGIPDEDMELAPVLSMAFTQLGVRSPSGEQLDYVRAQERTRAEIYGLGSGYGGNARTGRRELDLDASASSPAEVEAAIGWLRAYLRDRARGDGVRSRLVDLIRRSVTYYRNLFQQSEESWVSGAAAAYMHQDQPLYMAIHSPFTALRHLSRLRWRLEDPASADAVAHLALLEDVASLLDRDGSRADVAGRLAAANGELAGALGAELGHLPDTSWRPDLARLIGETREDLAVSPGDTLARIDRALDRVLCRRGARVQIMGNPANAAKAADLVKSLLAELPPGEAASVPRFVRERAGAGPGAAPDAAAMGPVGGAATYAAAAPDAAAMGSVGALATRAAAVVASATATVAAAAATVAAAAGHADGSAVQAAPRGPRRGEPLVLARLRERLPALAGAARPVHVGLVNDGTKSGVHVVSAPGPDYLARSPEDMHRLLAIGVFAGAGPQAMFMQTWSAGLAYSNGLRSAPSSGTVRYYAERCPDLARTMKFVAGIATTTPIDDPFLLEYSLANAFGDYRGMLDFSSRGEALANDLEDGTTPEIVRGFKTALIRAAREPEALAAVRAAVPAAVGKVLVGVGPKVSADPGAIAFVIGPAELLDGYDQYLRDEGEASSLVRLYPRDFWPLPAAAAGDGK